MLQLVDRRTCDDETRDQEQRDIYVVREQRLGVTIFSVLAHPFASSSRDAEDAERSSHKGPSSFIAGATETTLACDSVATRSFPSRQ